MKYRVFPTEAEALAAEAQVSLDIGCSIVGVNAKTGEPQQCGGLWTVVETLVVADTKEELDQYIVDNELKLSTDGINI